MANEDAIDGRPLEKRLKRLSKKKVNCSFDQVSLSLAVYLWARKYPTLLSFDAHLSKLRVRAKKKTDYKQNMACCPSELEVFYSISLICETFILDNPFSSSFEVDPPKEVCCLSFVIYTHCWSFFCLLMITVKGNDILTYLNGVLVE